MADKTTGKLKLWIAKITDKISDTINIYLSENFSKIDDEFSSLKDDVDEHKTDDTKHITSTERTIWNNKLDASAYTAADVLAKIKTVDGDGSGLDADLLDGAHAGNGPNNVLKLDSGGFVPLPNIPGTLTGKSADMVDGKHFSDIQNDAQIKVDTHASLKQTHGISSGYYIAKTSRSDQLPAWGDIQGKPDLALSADLAAHKVEIASPTQLGHVKIGRNLAIDSDGTLHAQANSGGDDGGGGSGKKIARFVIGTSTAGWAESDVDYLCDGVDDQEEIIQALNALPATGGEVVILDGIYNITASINIPKDNVSIRGSGNATILKRMYNSTNTDSGSTAKGLITLNGKSGCKIQGLQIDGNKATYTASYNYGIRLYSSSDNTVTGNTYNNNSYGIYLDSSSNNTITGNTCNNNSYEGISLYSSSNNTITGNTCNNSYDGIDLYSSSDNTVTGNTCNNNSYEGIYLYNSSNNTITGNTCCNNSYDGIYLDSSSDNTVTGNTCNNNSYEGIYLDSSSNNNTITGNTCNNNNEAGIFLSSSSNNTITGNTCIRGIGTPEDYTTDQHTILLSATGNNYNLISSNNCMGKAVVVEGGAGNSAWGNKFDNTDDLP